ncbi:hypothetical protein QEH52_19580 [Coraliomargarita sp. SDUM461003]|uniref:Uncharacterized protein n=1 Tax=Thalassobacterium maritimum TaxID=3041265 RepID=A0ABU1B005_9BACT|nr:hypothetical protein [Coraliomargarita sp. SDUM461003]MDQ8209729.1 hypothetical protein [Coraliomargarita sp. SDUM461003]
MKRILTSFMLLISLSAGLVASTEKEKELEDFKRFGIQEISLNVFYDIFRLARNDISLRDDEFHYPVLEENEEIYKRLDDVFSVIKDDRIFFEGSHPFLWAYRIKENEWLAIFIHIKIENEPGSYFIQQNLRYSDGGYFTQDMRLYRTEEEIAHLISLVDRLPFILRYTPVYFTPRKEKDSNQSGDDNSE